MICKCPKSTEKRKGHPCSAENENMISTWAPSALSIFSICINHVQHSSTYRPLALLTQSIQIWEHSFRSMQYWPTCNQAISYNLQYLTSIEMQFQILMKAIFRHSGYEPHFRYTGGSLCLHPESKIGLLPLWQYPVQFSTQLPYYHAKFLLDPLQAECWHGLGIDDHLCRALNKRHRDISSSIHFYILDFHKVIDFIFSSLNLYHNMRHRLPP